MKLDKVFAAAAFGAMMACSYASAAIVIYQDGTLNTTGGGATITQPGADPSQAISNSFTVSDNTVTVQNATFGAVVFQGVTPLSISWSIGSEAFGSEYGMGSADLNNVYQTTYDDGSGTFFDVYLSSFDLTSLPLTPGSYYFTLSDVVTDSGDPIAWSFSDNGQSSAFYKDVDNGVVTQGSSDFGPNFFVLQGSVVDNGQGSPVPEPASLAIFAGGLASLAAVRRRKAKAKV